MPEHVENTSSNSRNSDNPIETEFHKADPDPDDADDDKDYDTDKDDSTLQETEDNRG